MNDDDYDAAADFAGSIAECYRAIRERIARGGPPWVPPTIVMEPSNAEEHANSAAHVQSHTRTGGCE